VSRGRRLSQADAVAGVESFAAHLAQALERFDAPLLPLWKRTQDGMTAFKGLKLDNLPPRLLRDIDTRFAAINQILAGYTPNTWDDLQHVSDAHLHEIQRLIRGFATDP
jgi:hypothetical protein